MKQKLSHSVPIRFHDLSTVIKTTLILVWASLAYSFCVGFYYGFKAFI